MFFQNNSLAIGISILRWVFVFFLGLWMVGCDPIPYSSSDDYSSGAQNADRTISAHSDKDALKLVKQGPAQNSNLTNEEWVEQLIADEKGQVMFPLWTAKRKGANRYEIRYAYTVLEPDHKIQKKGVSWTADLVLRIVGPPRTLPPKELAGRGQDRWLRERQITTNTLYKKVIRECPVLIE